MDKLTPLYLYQYCKNTGIKIERAESDSGLLTLYKAFTPDNKAEYTQTESDVSIIYDVPYIKSQSSVWGTTGDGIGGFVGCKNGYMRINRSACKKTFIKELNRLIEKDI